MHAGGVLGQALCKGLDAAAAAAAGRAPLPPTGVNSAALAMRRRLPPCGAVEEATNVLEALWTRVMLRANSMGPMAGCHRRATRLAGLTKRVPFTPGSAAPGQPCARGSNAASSRGSTSSRRGAMVVQNVERRRSVWRIVAQGQGKHVLPPVQLSNLQRMNENPVAAVCRPAVPSKSRYKQVQCVCTPPTVRTVRDQGRHERQLAPARSGGSGGGTFCRRSPLPRRLIDVPKCQICSLLNPGEAEGVSRQRDIHPAVCQPPRRSPDLC